MTTPNTPANGGQILTYHERIDADPGFIGVRSKEHMFDYVVAEVVDLRASLAAPAIPTVDRNAASIPQHTDDIAIDAFAAEMKRRMAEKRAAGRKGWDNPKKCSLPYLMDLLRKTPVSKPVDIGNYAMMLFNRAVMENHGYPPRVAQPSDFDAWLQSPYTKVLQKSIAEDYIPKHAEAVAQPAAQVAVPDFRKVLVDVRNSLQFVNDSPGGGISDTLWMMDQPETIFDHIDAALATPATVKTAEGL